ncbi:hypothetical protein Tco_0556992 [Tanacetum coccineum]
MGSSLTHKTGPTVDTNEENEGRPSCQLNLTLASSVSQINPCQGNDTIPQSFQDIENTPSEQCVLGAIFDGKTWVFVGDIYGDHAILCDGIVGIKHRHNIVRDTLVDICFRSRISAGKEVDIGLGGGRDKPLRPVDIYGFLPFLFSSLGELEKDALTLLKRIRRFSVTQDIGARTAVHIFNRICFAIAKGVEAQIEKKIAGFPDDGVVDNHNPSRPDFGYISHNEFPGKLRLELSPAVSDINFVSNGTQSSNEDGGVSLWT